MRLLRNLKSQGDDAVEEEEGMVIAASQLSTTSWYQRVTLTADQSLFPLYRS
ncbi:hydroxymethyltransferase [Klebsiella michiganensis]|uniref:Hydroxymethyltransferase n=1 Tax=Klebsiella michiganensis TaxID=1134687 RepID=A0A7H4N815_9ENTR|nr:hydroxymethyltransferase [Klebsiella michiganensis]